MAYSKNNQKFFPSLYPLLMVPCFTDIAMPIRLALVNGKIENVIEAET